MGCDVQQCTAPINYQRPIAALQAAGAVYGACSCAVHAHCVLTACGARLAGQVKSSQVFVR